MMERQSQRLERREKNYKDVPRIKASRLPANPLTLFSSTEGRSSMRWIGSRSSRITRRRMRETVGTGRTKTNKTHSSSSIGLWMLWIKAHPKNGKCIRITAKVNGGIFFYKIVNG